MFDSSCIWYERRSLLNRIHLITRTIAQVEEVIDDGQADIPATTADNGDNSAVAAPTITLDDSINPTSSIEAIPTTTDIPIANGIPAASDIPTASDIPAASDIPTATTATDNTLPTAVESELPAVAANKTVDPLVCQALQQWYKSLNGNTWVVRTGWDSTDMTTCCSWFNVRCNKIGQVLRV
jgi:hypothetical protein